MKKYGKNNLTKFPKSCHVISCLLSLGYLILLGMVAYYLPEYNSFVFVVASAFHLLLLLFLSKKMKIIISKDEVENIIDSQNTNGNISNGATDSYANEINSENEITDEASKSFLKKHKNAIFIMIAIMIAILFIFFILVAVFVPSTNESSSDSDSYDSYDSYDDDDYDSYNYHRSYHSHKTTTTSPGAFYDENGNGKIDNGEFAIGDDDLYVYADGDFYEWG